MKKLAFIIALAALLAAPAYSVECDTSMCPAVPKVTGGFTAGLSKITGMNWAISSVLEGQIKKQMDKELSADFKVNIEPFGAKSLLEGKFKKFTAEAPKANIEGLSLSNIKAETLCGYNHFVYSDNKIYTAENFMMSFSADMTSDDLQKITETKDYKNAIKSFNVNVGGITVSKVYDSRVYIKNNRLTYSFMFASPLTLGKAKRVTTSMAIGVEDGKITFSDVKTGSSIPRANLDSILPIVNKLNPFSMNTNILDNPESSIEIKDIKIDNDIMHIKGLVIVPKNYYNK